MVSTTSTGNISTTKTWKCIMLYLLLLVDKWIESNKQSFSPTNCSEASKRRERLVLQGEKEEAKKMAKPQQIVLLGSTWGIRNTFHSLLAILTTLLVVTAIYLTQDGGQVSQETNVSGDPSSSKCDLFSGKWVFDNQSYPLYKEQQCTFMSDQLACEKFGRKDLSYQNWKWKPHQCDLPRSLSFSPLPP